MSTAILGTLGADAETAGEGDKFRARIRVADNFYMGKDKEDLTTWYTVTIWDKYAKSMLPHLTKGKQFFISGVAVNRKYQKDGEDRYELCIMKPEFKFVRDGKGEKPSDMPF